MKVSNNLIGQIIERFNWADMPLARGEEPLPCVRVWSAAAPNGRNRYEHSESCSNALYEEVIERCGTTSQ